jgi:hypothetical protein
MPATQQLLSEVHASCGVFSKSPERADATFQVDPSVVTTALYVPAYAPVVLASAMQCVESTQDRPSRWYPEGVDIAVQSDVADATDAGTKAGNKIAANTAQRMRILDTLNFALFLKACRAIASESRGTCTVRRLESDDVHSHDLK